MTSKREEEVAFALMHIKKCIERGEPDSSIEMFLSNLYTTGYTDYHAANMQPQIDRLMQQYEELKSGGQDNG